MFGCDVYTKVLGSLRKLDERSKKLVGFTKSGYRLWNEKKRKIVIRKDVIFNEVTEKDKEINERQVIELEQDQKTKKNKKRF